jgi:hypothetical protein
MFLSNELLSPGILFDHQTIDDLADYLMRELPLRS